MGIWKSKNPPPSSTFNSRKSQNNTLTNTRGKTAKYDQSEAPYPNLARNLWDSGQATPKKTNNKPEEMYRKKCVGTTAKCQDAQTVVYSQSPERNHDGEEDDGEIKGCQPPILLLVPDDHGRNGPPDLFYPTEVIDEPKPKSSSWKPPTQDKKSSIYAWLEQSERAKQAAGGFLNESKQTIKWDDELELELSNPQTSRSIPVPPPEHSLIILDPANLNICMPHSAQSPVSHPAQNPQPQNKKEEAENKLFDQNPNDPPPIINHTTDLAPLHKIKRESSSESIHNKNKDKEKTLKKNESSRQQYQQRRSNRRYHHYGRDAGRGERRKNIVTDKAIKDRILSALHGNREYYRNLRNARLLTDTEKDNERERDRERDDERDRRNSRSRRKTVTRPDVSIRHVKERENKRQSRQNNDNKNKDDDTEEEEEDEDDEAKMSEIEERHRNTRPSTSKNYKRKIINKSNRDRDSRLPSALESNANITEKNIKSIAQLLLEGLHHANKKYSKITEENNVKHPREMDIEKELRRGGNGNNNNINNIRDRDSSSRKKLNFNEALARHISKSHLRFSDFPPFESRVKKQRERENDSSSDNNNDNDNHSSRSRRKKKMPTVLVKKSTLKKESRQPSTRVGNTRVKRKSGHSKTGEKSTAKEFEEDETTNNDDDDEDELNNSPSLTDIRYLPVFMTRISDVPMLEHKEFCHRLMKELNDGQAQGDVHSVNDDNAKNFDGDEFPMTGLTRIKIDFSKMECHFTKRPLNPERNQNCDDCNDNTKKKAIQDFTLPNPLKTNNRMDSVKNPIPIPMKKSTSSIIISLHRTKRDMDFKNQSLKRTQPTTDFSFIPQNSIVDDTVPQKHTQTQLKAVTFPDRCQDSKFEMNLIKSRNSNTENIPIQRKNKMIKKQPTLFYHKSKLLRRKSKTTKENYMKNDKLVLKQRDRANKTCQNQYWKNNSKTGNTRNRFLETKTSKQKKSKTKSNNSIKIDIIKCPPIPFSPMWYPKIPPPLHENYHKYYKNDKCPHHSHVVQHCGTRIYQRRESTKLECLYKADPWVKDKKLKEGNENIRNENFCKGDCDICKHEFCTKSNSSTSLANTINKNNFEMNKEDNNDIKCYRKLKEKIEEPKIQSLKSILKPGNQRFPSKYKSVESTKETPAPSLNLLQNTSAEIRKSSTEVDSNANVQMKENQKGVRNMAEGKLNKNKKTGNNKKEKGKKYSEKRSKQTKNENATEETSRDESVFDGKNSNDDSYFYSYSDSESKSETRIGKKPAGKSEKPNTKKKSNDNDDDNNDENNEKPVKPEDESLPKMTTEGGGICFKLPGRVTHKTSIKVAHYPRQEAIYVNLPYSCYPNQGNYYCPMPCQPQPPELMNNCNIYNYGEKPYCADPCAPDPGNGTGNVEYLPC